MRHLAILPIRTHINSLCWRILRCQVFFCGALTTGTYELVHSAVCVYSTVCVRVRVYVCVCTCAAGHCTGLRPQLQCTCVYSTGAGLPGCPSPTLSEVKRKVSSLLCSGGRSEAIAPVNSRGRGSFNISRAYTHVSHARAIAYRYRDTYVRTYV